MTVTPQPTPVWARINVKGSNGAVIRAEPGYNAAIVKSLLNGIIVEVLNEVATADGATWVKIRTADGVEGWIVRALLATATPAPGW
jgi:SH3-like domain-containing protein